MKPPPSPSVADASAAFNNNCIRAPARSQSQQTERSIIPPRSLPLSPPYICFSPSPKGVTKARSHYWVLCRLGRQGHGGDYDLTKQWHVVVVRGPCLVDRVHTRSLHDAHYLYRVWDDKGGRRLGGGGDVKALVFWHRSLLRPKNNNCRKLLR